MHFQRELWTRFEAEGIPIYVRGDRPQWFVPTTAGDRVLQDWPNVALDGGLQARRFMERLPGDPPLPYPGRGQVLEQMIRDGADLAIRPARRHDHGVGDRTLADEIDGDGVLGLHVVDAGEDEAKSLLGVRTHLGDLVGRAAGAGPGDYRCWQGAFPFFGRCRA